MPGEIHAVAVALAWSMALGACGGERDTGARNDADAPAGAPDLVQDSPGAAAPSEVTATVRDAGGRELGTLTLGEGAQGITVAGRLAGLPPGEHGMHLHRVGRCEPPAVKSAADHWNPTGRQHGPESPEGPHFGDLPNITVGKDSSATVQATTPGGALRGGNALVDADGAAVVVHAGRDDYRSQPSGNSGDPIACGVVAGPS